MRISVVIPAYNEEEYLAHCLRCLMKQSRQADEIIVVDNNSRDRTAEIASMFPVRVIQETTQGMTPARNAGFNAAIGEIIARTDADALPPEHWLESIEEIFKNPSVDGFTGPICFYDYRYGDWEHFSRMYLQSMRLIQGGRSTMYGPNMVIRKTMWERVRESVTLNDRKVHEDIDIAIHVNRAGGFIHQDLGLTMPVSARRLKNNPFSAFAEYPLRLAKTFAANSRLPVTIKSGVKKISKPLRSFKSNQSSRRKR